MVVWTNSKEFAHHHDQQAPFDERRRLLFSIPTFRWTMFALWEDDEDEDKSIQVKSEKCPRIERIKYPKTRRN